MENVQLDLNTGEISIIMEALSALPWRDVNALMGKINTQVMQQRQAPTAVPEMPETA